MFLTYPSAVVKLTTAKIIASIAMNLFFIRRYNTGGKI